MKLIIFIPLMIASLTFSMEAGFDEKIILSGKISSRYKDRDLLSVRTDSSQEFCLPRKLFKKSRAGESFFIEITYKEFRTYLEKYNYKKRSKRKKGQKCFFKVK